MSSFNENQKNSRRKFLKTGSLLGLASLLSPIEMLSTPKKQKAERNESHQSKNLKITLLFTSDIHGQLLPHDEFFWENESAVYKKRGGLSHLKTMIEFYRKAKSSHTILFLFSTTSNMT
jgi:S-sulfosulfanyl-L-cysteine sulfohydrolase